MDAILCQSIILIHQLYNDEIKYNDVIHVSSAKPTAEMLSNPCTRCLVAGHA